MERYILASDFDGTLYQNGVVSKESVEAIVKFRNAGNLFGIVTGRDFVKGFNFFKSNNLFPFDFIIAGNGAAAYDKDGNVYFVETANGKQAFGESTLACELLKQCLSLSQNQCGIAFVKSRFDFHPEYPDGAEVGDMKYSPVSILRDVEDFVLANVVCSGPTHAAEVTAVLRENFGHNLNPLQNGMCIDITPAGVNKATGIAKLADCLGIPYENIWTAGDNLNDMSMIKSYHGCAMTGGVEEVKKASEYVCDTVAEVIKIIMNHKHDL